MSPSVLGGGGRGFNCAEFLLARAERAPNKTLISVFDYTQTDRSDPGILSDWKQRRGINYR